MMRRSFIYLSKVFPLHTESTIYGASYFSLNLITITSHCVRQNAMLVAKPSVKVHFYARFNFEFTIFVVLIFDTNYKKLPKNMQKN